MLHSGSKSSDHGYCYKHTEVCGGISSFHVELSVHVQLSLSPSACPLQLSGYVLPVSCLNVSFYLLLMFVWSVHPTNPTDIYGTFSDHCWYEIITESQIPLQRLRLHDEGKQLNSEHQQLFCCVPVFTLALTANQEFIQKRTFYKWGYTSWCFGWLGSCPSSSDVILLKIWRDSCSRSIALFYGSHL